MKLLALLLLPTPLFATPGAVLDSSFPEFTAQATVLWSAADASGGVFVAGDFTAVNEASRPGLARLNPDGSLDSAFSPVDYPWPGSDQLLFNGQEIGGPRGHGLFPLGDGKLLVLGGQRWDLLGPDGTAGQPGFADLPRTETAPRPQFEADGRVWVIAGNELRAYHSASLERDPGFAMTGAPLPPYEAAPAGDGKLWVLGRSERKAPSSWISEYTFTIFRVEPNGTLDATFLPRELPQEYSYSLETAEGGGFRLTGEWTAGYWYWPAPFSLSLTTDSFDAAGNLLGRISLAAPRFWDRRQIVHPTADSAIHPSLDGTTLVRKLANSAIPDPAFSIRMVGPEVPVAGPVSTRTLQGLADDRILVGGTRRFLADGTPDAGWQVPRLSRPAAISQLVRLPAGSVLATGEFDQAGGIAAPGAVILKQDGSRDPSFQPSFDFRQARRMRQLPDGGWLALFEVYARDGAGNGSQLVRFRADGSFASLWPVPLPPGSAILYYGGGVELGVQSNGSALVTTINESDITSYFLRKISPDGSEPFSLDTSNPSRTSTALLVLPDDSYLRGNIHFAADGTKLKEIAGLETMIPAAQLPDGSVVFQRLAGLSAGPVLARWHPSTGVDATFMDTLGEEPSRNGVSGVCPAADGKLLVWGSFSDGRSLLRLHANGQIDPTFRTPSGIVRAVMPEPGGSVLVAGDFENGELLRLDDTRASGFNAWIKAATTGSGWAGTSLDPDADPDGDGSSNRLEYAAGSDPALCDPMRSQPRSTGPSSWVLMINPEAPEISRRLEVSSDLRQWLPADSTKVRLETTRAGFGWSQLPGHGSLFSRIRIE